MYHICFGTRFNGIDKLTVGLTLNRTSPVHIQSILDGFVKTIVSEGYDLTIAKWKQQVSKLVIRDFSNNPLSDKTNLQQILSDGFGYSTFVEVDGNQYTMLETGLCSGGYILNLDEEVIEFYLGDQYLHHNSGRYIEKIDKRSSFYPCALWFEVPLFKLSKFNISTFLLPTD